MAGQGQAPARQALRRPACPIAGAVTLSKMCGSGMSATMFAHDMLLAGSADVMVAGGMESMTNAPHLLARRAAAVRLPRMFYDHMVLDGLEDAYERGRAMGTFGEDCVAKYNFTREAQDAFAIASTERANAGQRVRRLRLGDHARHGGRQGRRRESATTTARARPSSTRSPRLKPAFKKDGTITAATSSSINDGAAALVMMRESTAKKLGLTPLARIVAHAMHAQAPDWFTTAPVGAIDKLLAKTGWAAKDVDLWEVNEAFAAVTMALMAELKLPHDIVNVNGGACALGHPIGASGARIMVTLLGATAQARAARRAWPPCASAAAKPRPWRSNWSETPPRASLLRPKGALSRLGAARRRLPCCSMKTTAPCRTRCAPLCRSASRRMRRAGTRSTTSRRTSSSGLAELGCYGVAVPTEWDGAGLDYLALALILEEIAAGDGGTTTVVSVNNCPVCSILMGWANDAQKEQWLKPLASGEHAGRVLPDRAARGLRGGGPAHDGRARRRRTTCSTA